MLTFVCIYKYTQKVVRVLNVMLAVDVRKAHSRLHLATCAAVCAPGYARTSGNEPCQQCGPASEAWGSAILSGVAMLLLLGILLVINRRAPSSALRPLVNFGQTLSIMLLFNAPWPEAVVAIGR